MRVRVVRVLVAMLVAATFDVPTICAETHMTAEVSVAWTSERPIIDGPGRLIYGGEEIAISAAGGFTRHDSHVGDVVFPRHVLR